MFIACFAIFFILAVGCSNDIEDEGNKIVVENKGDGTRREIKDSKEVQKAVNILNAIVWDNALASMSHGPDYEFYIENTSKEKESNKEFYQLWISPNKDKIELTLGSKYVQLNEEKSGELFKILTGKNLDKV